VSILQPINIIESHNNDDYAQQTLYFRARAHMLVLGKETACMWLLASVPLLLYIGSALAPAKHLTDDNPAP
jgi:hypothetical protein